MKRISITAIAISLSFAFVQAQVKTQATIVAKTTIESDEDENAGAPPPPPGAVMMRFGGDGETNTKIFIKNGLVKTVNSTEVNIITSIRDNDMKTTTNIIEMNGTKNATITTDEQREKMQKRIDSMMQARTSANLDGANNNNPPKIEVALRDGSKKIAGIDCKKAVIITTRRNRTDSFEVWYAPGIKFANVSTPTASAGFGGMSFGNRGNTNDGFDQLNGFPMYYKRSMGRGRTQIVEVTKVDFEKEIKDSEFLVPKGIEVKPMDENATTNFGGGNFRIRQRD